jgi:hypothetical protein
VNGPFDHQPDTDRCGQMIDFIKCDALQLRHGSRNTCVNELEFRGIDVLKILAPPGGEIVDDDHSIPPRNQVLSQM